MKCINMVEKIFSALQTLFPPVVRTVCRVMSYAMNLLEVQG